MIRLHEGHTIYQGLPGQTTYTTIEIPRLDFTEAITTPKPTEESLGLTYANLDGTKLWPRYADTAINLREIASTPALREGERTDLIIQAQLHAAVAQDLQARSL